MKILITGCRGQLGTELQKQLAAESCVLGPLPERLRKATVIPVDVDELDITDREATINYMRRHQPESPYEAIQHHIRPGELQLLQELLLYSHPTVNSHCNRPLLNL